MEMSSRWSRSIALAGAAVAALVVVATWTDSAAAVDGEESDHGLTSFAGRYVHSGGQRDRDGLHAAIDRVVAQMSFFIQDIARGQIRANVQPDARIILETIDAGHARVTLGEWTSPMMPIDGTARRITGPDGTATRFSVRHHGGRLYIRAETARGMRESWLTVDPASASLQVQVRITAQQLPAPIRYDLHYRRGS